MDDLYKSCTTKIPLIKGERETEKLFVKSNFIGFYHFESNDTINGIKKKMFFFQK